MKNKVVFTVLLFLVAINIQYFAGIELSTTSSSDTYKNTENEIYNNYPVDDIVVEEEINSKISTDPLTTISIDGSTADWTNVNPIFTNYEPDYSYDYEIDSTFIINNDTHLFFRVDFLYENPNFDEIFVNVSLALPNGSVFIIMASVDYTLTHIPSIIISEGIEIDSTKINDNPSLVLFRYDAAVSSDYRTIEFGFPLSDLDIEYTDNIDMVFWTNVDIRFPQEYYLDYQLVDPRIDSYRSHGPIVAYSDTELASLAGVHGWLGDGSSSTPYIINNVSIISEWEKCIDIQDTNSYIIINNSYLSSYTDGGISFSRSNFGSTSQISFLNTIIVNGYNTAIELNEVWYLHFWDCEFYANRVANIYDSRHIEFHSSYIRGYDYGLLAQGGQSMLIWSNQILGTTGITLDGIYDCTIAQNTFKDNRKGLRLISSYANTIVWNEFINSGLELIGSNLEQYLQDDVYSNTVNGKPLIFWQHESNMVVPASAGAIVLINCTNIEVSNQVISRTTVGLTIVNGTAMYIHHNNFTNNVLGIDSTFPDSSFFTSNYFIDNEDGGIALYSSPNNTIESNIFINCDLYIPPYDIYDILQLSVFNNTVNGKPLIYWEFVDSATVPTNVGQIILIGCSNVDIENLIFKGGNVQAISVYYSTDVDVNNCTFIDLWQKTAVYYRYSSLTDIIYSNFENCDIGIYIGYADANILYRNNFTDCFLGIYSSNQFNISVGFCELLNCDYGIYFYRSNMTSAYNNIISNSRWLGIYYSNCFEGEAYFNTISNGNDGISMILTDSLSIDNNNIEYNGGTGIFVSSCKDNLIAYNIIDNNMEGIYLADSHENFIIDNYISYNYYYGLTLMNSGDNIISWNSFILNNYEFPSQQAQDTGTIVYDNSIYCNYWSDWLSPDSDSNGIVDIPYSLDGDIGSIDEKPLTDNSINISPPEVTYPNGNEIVDGTITIQWEESHDRLYRDIVYNVYYSDDNGITWYMLYSNVDSNVITLDTSILSNGNYLIGVEAYNGDSYSFDSSDNTFTIDNTLHYLTVPIVTYPNGGETVSGIVTVTWSAAIDSQSLPVTYDLYYSWDGGSSWTMIAGDIVGTSYNWEIYGLSDIYSYTIKIEAKSTGLTAVDESDGVFYVDSTSVHTLTLPTVVYPNGGETISGTVNIVWLAAVDSLSIPITYLIYYSNDGGYSWNMIASYVNSTNYYWDTTAVSNDNNYKIKIEALASDLLVYDISDSSFTISNGGSSNTGTTSSGPIEFTPGLTTPFLIIAFTALIFYKKKRK